MSPLVSVIMPVYNEEQRVEEAIQSILDQTLTDFEFLVVDDGSTDGTPERLRRQTDPRLRITYLPQNEGRATAKNRALDQARGTYVAFMDADDRSVPTRLETQVAFMTAHPEVDVVGTALRTYGEEQEHVWRPPLDHDHICAKMLFSCSVYGATALLRRDWLEAHSLRFEPGHYVEDHDLWVRALGNVGFANLPDVLYLHHHVTSERQQDTVLKQSNLQPVVQSQLRALGITPTPRQFQMHMALCQPAGYLLASAADVQDCVEWVDALLAQNRVRAIYDQDALTTIVDQRMDDVLNAVEDSRKGLLRRWYSRYVWRRVGQSLQHRVNDVWKNRTFR